MQPANTEVDEPSREGRRRFCAALAVIGAGACTGPPNLITTAGLDGGFGTSQSNAPGDLADSHPSDDLAENGSEDFSQKGGDGDMATKASEDMAGSSSCSGNVSGGAASAVAEGSQNYISSGHLFLCRDTGGLYALTSKCTHSGCTVTAQATQFYCHCHGATFDLNGQNPTRPASSPLVHYELCVDSSGNVEINTSKTVAATTRT